MDMETRFRPREPSSRGKTDPDPGDPKMAFGPKIADNVDREISQDF
jgi:hypothetical protein